MLCSEDISAEINSEEDEKLVMVPVMMCYGWDANTMISKTSRNLNLQTTINKNFIS